jgi:hypothetical protein
MSEDYTYPGPDVFAVRAAGQQQNPGLVPRIMRLPPVREALNMLGLASQQEGDMRDRMIRDALTHIQTLETAIEAIMLGVRHVCEGTGAEPPSDSMPAPQRPVAARGWGASARPTAGTIKSGPIFGLNDTVEIPPGYDPKATQPGMALKDGGTMSVQGRGYHHHNQGKKGNVHPHPDDPSQPVDPMNPDAIARPAGGDAVGGHVPNPDDGPGGPIPNPADAAGEVRRAAGETSDQNAAGGPTQLKEDSGEGNPHGENPPDASAAAEMMEAGEQPGADGGGEDGEPSGEQPPDESPPPAAEPPPPARGGRRR